MARALSASTSYAVACTMPRRRLPRSLRQRLVAEAHDRCAYCHSPTTITGARPVIDHIIPEAAGGQGVWDNLCVACHSCNEFKGSQTVAADPLTGERVSLFHPRRQTWGGHFGWSADGSLLIGTTPVGRATVAALQMNHPLIVEARRRWAMVGWHPPPDDR